MRLPCFGTHRHARGQERQACATEPYPAHPPAPGTKRTACCPQSDRWYPPRHAQPAQPGVPCLPRAALPCDPRATRTRRRRAPAPHGCPRAPRAQGGAVAVPTSTLASGWSFNDLAAEEWNPRAAAGATLRVERNKASARCMAGLGLCECSVAWVRVFSVWW